eukprot:7387807-Prymnesium_polylepis.1
MEHCRVLTIPHCNEMLPVHLKQLKFFGGVDEDTGLELDDVVRVDGQRSLLGEAVGQVLLLFGGEPHLD